MSASRNKRGERAALYAGIGVAVGMGVGVAFSGALGIAGIAVFGVVGAFVGMGVEYARRGNS